MMKVQISAAKPMDDNDGDEAKKPDQYEIERWANTLTDAEDIKNDPEKMKHVQPHLEKKAKAIKSIADLKRRAEKMLAK